MSSSLLVLIPLGSAPASTFTTAGTTAAGSRIDMYSSGSMTMGIHEVCLVLFFSTNAFGLTFQGCWARQIRRNFDELLDGLVEGTKSGYVYLDTAVVLYWRCTVFLHVSFEHTYVYVYLEL